MLKAPPRKARASPSPMRMSGTARTSVAEVSAYQEPKAPDQRAPSAAPESYPASSSPHARTTSPARSAAAPTTQPEARTRASAAGEHERAQLVPGRPGRRLD